MSFVVDTNVLVYAADADSPLHGRCRSLVDAWRGDVTPWFVTWSILYEFLRVVTHRRVLRRPWTIDGAWSFVSALLASPTLEVLVEGEGHRAAVDEIVRSVAELAGNVVHDVHTVALMREHGIGRIVTRDSDFHRFAFVEVVDPLAT